jgi:O-antigen ligase
MGLLKIFSLLFILAFPVAEVGRIQFPNGVAVSLNDILLIGLILSWVIYIFRNKKNILKSKLFKPIILFSVIAFSSLVFNIVNLSLDRLLISFLYLLRWISYACIYFIFMEFDDKFKLKISYTMLFSGTVIVLLGFVQFFFYPSLRNLYYLGWDEHLYRLFSTFLDPNFVGAFLAIFSIFILSFLPNIFKNKDWIKLTLFSVAALTTIVALYLTYSRSALIMLAVGIVTFLLIAGWKKLILAVIIVMVLSVFILPKSFTTEGTNFLRATSSSARIASVKEVMSVIQKSPVIGVGFNAYRYAMNKQGYNGKIWQTSHGGAGTDNSFLFVLATTGIIGFAAFVYLIFKIMRLGVLNKKKNQYAVVLISSLAGLMVGSIFVNSLFYVFILEWIWIIAAFTEKN